MRCHSVWLKTVDVYSCISTRAEDIIDARNKIDLRYATMVGVGLLGRWKSICMPQGVYPGVWKCISYLLPTMVARSIFRDQYLVLIHLPHPVTRNCIGYTAIQHIHQIYILYILYSIQRLYSVYIIHRYTPSLCPRAPTSYLVWHGLPSTGNRWAHHPSTPR